MNLRTFIGIIALQFIWNSLSFAGYRVEGRVNLDAQWQPQIFMAAIHTLDDYYNAYPDLVIDAAIIESDGSFVLKGDNLPDEKKFYRLYLMKVENSEFDACLYVGGDDHNFMHIILDNNSQLEIYADSSSRAPFANYNVVGDHDNEMMRTVSQIVLPSFYFYQIKYTSELKFSREKLNRDLLDFADTCQSTMASLAAMTNTDFDKYYLTNQNFYQKFLKNLSREIPDNSYLADFKRKLAYYDPSLFDSSLKNWIIGICSILILSLLIITLKQNKTIRYLSDQSKEPFKGLAQLTSKEREIFDLIAQGKSNKEIASTLFVELSTVKTHINKIYAKLDVTNRKEAISISEMQY